MDKNRIKVLFDLDVEDDYPIVSSESLWAVMGSNNECIIGSIPFYVQGVSYGDTIEFDEEENYYYCVNILKSGGHSTLKEHRMCDDPRVAGGPDVLSKSAAPSQAETKHKATEPA